MALRIRIPRNNSKQGLAFHLAAAVLLCCVFSALALLLTGGYYYLRYRGIVDARLQHPLFATTAKIYATPREVRPGQHLPLAQVVRELRTAGYSDPTATTPSPLGTFVTTDDSVDVHPGPQSYHSQDGALIRFSRGVVSSLTDDHGQPLSSYELEPLLITGLSEDASRTKRRLVTYSELPPNLVQAVMAIEDRRFFEHDGVNYSRLFSAALRDILTGRKVEGGSTLTMQLARGFFLTPEKKFKRKIIEIVITFQLEHRFTKQQIFEMYANEINLGQRGSFSIDGFGEASQVYFGKDVGQLNLAECALLAGMIQRPNYFSPYRHPDRALERRNLVLDSMVETGAITKETAEQTKLEPLHLSKESVDASDAPYFVDLVREQLTQKLGEHDFNREGLRIYTSLDPYLQTAATAAVSEAIPAIDKQVDQRAARLHRIGSLPYPQVALIALNPHTGQVLALVGGRSYGLSQLNHAVASRPTGSIFKPIVYAAAFNTAVAGATLPGQDALFSPLTQLNDEQTTYQVNGQDYTPRNFEGEYHGQVNARFALMRSLNNATISLASLVGFDTVATLAQQLGIASARATPAVAIGAYDATPLDMAGVYTAFANGGLKIDPWMVASVRTPSGDVLTDFTPTSKQILDPRVAYLTTSMMEAVLQGKGTGAGVRNLGFTVPAAGKTGTEHDAWFVGYTTNLLCIVWVGNDDYTDLKIEGAHAAAPIWASFMKRAVALPQYSDTAEFTPPDGVQLVQIDSVTNLPADNSCSTDTYTAAFLDGTVPQGTCSHPNGDHRNFLQKIFGLGNKKSQ